MEGRMSDRLTLANAIEDAGIERAKAERMASVIFDAIHDNVSTKGDLQAAKAELKADIATVRNDVQAVKAELKADIAAVRNDVQAVRAEVALIEHRLITRLGGMIVVTAGALFAAIHYWPPVGHG
jgi:predicted  nucleic acid-binding Zn-ribbon protein